MLNFMDSWNKKTHTWNAKEELYPQADIEDYNEVCDSFLKVVQHYSCISGTTSKSIYK
jgi:hypothetical protein